MKLWELYLLVHLLQVEKLDEGSHDECDLLYLEPVKKNITKETQPLFSIRTFYTFTIHVFKWLSFLLVCIQKVSISHLHEVVVAGPGDTKVNQITLVPPFGASIPLGQPAHPSMAGVQVQWS
jgi:hypothetical protein